MTVPWAYSTVLRVVKSLGGGVYTCVHIHVFMDTHVHIGVSIRPGL